ncbi:hypothetical protein [Thermoflexus sp.]|uniref:hypothetical protein n=1 Tax=Thermoflexus sp. TaxID=1969742 RepID=UPI0035E458D6
MAAPKQPACDGLKHADQEEPGEKRDGGLKAVALEGAASVSGKAKDERNTTANGEIPNCHEARHAQADSQDPGEDGRYSERGWDIHIAASTFDRFCALLSNGRNLVTPNGRVPPPREAKRRRLHAVLACAFVVDRGDALISKPLTRPWIMGWQVNRRRGLCELPNPLKGLPSCLSIGCYTVDLLVKH